jgi:AcrR family transcriptional regulator
LLDAAITAILDRGFYRASSNEIARIAGVSWGAIQYYFGTREQMLVAVLDREFDAFVASLIRLELTGDSARERIAQLVDVMFNFYARPEYLAIMQIHLNLSRDPDCEEATAQAMIRFGNGIDTGWHEVVRQALGGTKVDQDRDLFVYSLLRGVALGDAITYGAPRTMKRNLVRTPRDQALAREWLSDMLTAMVSHQ